MSTHSIYASALSPKPNSTPSAHSALSTKEPSTNSPKGAYLSPNGHTLNPRQCEAVDKALQGLSFNLMGGAGYGKTETTVTLIEKLLLNAKPLAPMGHKYIEDGQPDVLVLAYTNSAINHIRNQATGDKRIYMTIHKAIEFTVVYEDSIQSDGTIETKKIFVPKRNASSKLAGIRTVIIEESTLVDVHDLFPKLVQCLSPGCQLINIGDLNQQRPPFGRSLLEYTATRLPSVVLNIPYRQAGESPVTPLLHNIMGGSLEAQTAEGLKLAYQDFNKNGKLELSFYPERVPYEAFEDAWRTNPTFVAQQMAKLKYNPEDSIILIPYNKSFGTTAINIGINNHYSTRAGKPTHQIVSGFSYVYWAEGDYVLHDNIPCRIELIEPLAKHRGISYKPAEVGMSRYKAVDFSGAPALDHLDIDDLLLSKNTSSRERMQAERSVSHKITLFDLEAQRTFSISQQGDISSLIGSHARTTYKAQGRQWHNVIAYFHHSHKSLTREMLYTAASRTTHTLRLMCDKDRLRFAMERPQIQGDTVDEKIDWLHDNPVPSIQAPDDEDWDCPLNTIN